MDAAGGDGAGASSTADVGTPAEAAGSATPAPVPAAAQPVVAAAPAAGAPASAAPTSRSLYSAVHFFRGRDLAAKNMTTGKSDPYMKLYVCHPASDLSRDHLLSLLTAGLNPTPATKSTACSRVCLGISAGAMSDAMVALRNERLWSKQKVGKSGIVRSSLQPVWDATVNALLPTGREVLLIECWDYDLITKNDFMGGFVLLPEWFWAESHKHPADPAVDRVGLALEWPAPDWWQLCSRPDRPNVSGDVLISVAVKPATPEQISAWQASHKEKIAEPPATPGALTHSVSASAAAPAPAAATPAPISTSSGGTTPSLHHAASMSNPVVAATFGSAMSPLHLGPPRPPATPPPPLPETKAPETPIVGEPGRLVLRPHNHTRYCDRDDKVCTAEGRFREGEVLRVLVRGGVPPSIASQAVCIWYRSLPNDSTSFEAVDHASAQVPLPPIAVRGIQDLSDPSALNSNAGAAAQVMALYEQAIADPLQYFLSALDLGCYIKARVTLPGRTPFDTEPVGPIEVAPPKMRELWIEGDCIVGRVLRVQGYYFGGKQGATEYTWVRIGVDGTRTDRTGVMTNPDVPIPASDDDPAVYTDPRCYVLTEADIGCNLKVASTPCRIDGVKGYPTSSKPSAVVVATAEESISARPVTPTKAPVADPEDSD